MGRARTTLAVDAEVVSTTAVFDDLFRDHYEPVLRALYLLTGDVSEAEDLAQEAFARAYERRHQLSASGNPAGYVYRTALNVHRSRVRRAAVAFRRRGSLVQTRADGLAAVEDRDALRRALAGLPLKEREALILVAWLDMRHEDVARVLKTSPEAVRTRVSRAKARLRLAGKVENEDA
jgi:RNA polymerase sigma-70 factor (ECF subfamily)